MGAPGAYRRPTAARFFSDLSRRRVDTATATPQRRMVPRFPRWRSPLSGIPVSSQPPHGPFWSWCGVERSWRRRLLSAQSSQEASLPSLMVCTYIADGQRRISTKGLQAVLVISASCPWGSAAAMSLCARRPNLHQSCRNPWTPLRRLLMLVTKPPGLRSHPGAAGATAWD